MRYLFILILFAALGCGGEKEMKQIGSVKTMTVNGVPHVSIPASNVLIRYYELVPCSKADREYHAICSNGGYKGGSDE